MRIRSTGQRSPWRRLWRPHLPWPPNIGYLILTTCTKHDGRKNVCKAMKAAIERRFQEKVFSTTIVSAAKIQEAESTKKTVFQLDRQSTGARDFMELGREVLARLKLQPTDAENHDARVRAADAIGEDIAEVAYGRQR